MAQFSTRCSSLPDASYKLAVRQKLCAVSSVQQRIAAFEEQLSGSANTTTQPVFDKRSDATLPASQYAKPPSSFKTTKTQTHRDFSGSSVHSQSKNVTMKSTVKTNSSVYSNTSVSLTSTKSVWTNNRRLESTTIMKSKTQESNVSSLSRVHQHSKLSLSQQSNVTKEQSFTDGEYGVESITGTKSPRLPDRPKPSRTRGSQSKAKRSLPDVPALGKPPQKPNRPPGVDVDQFRRNIKFLNDALRGMTPRPAHPPTPPTPRPCQSSNHAAASLQQMDEDEPYDDVGIMNPPPLPSEEHPSKRREADLTKDMYQNLDDRWEKSKENQESKSGKGDTNHNKLTEEKQAEPKGAINTEEMKGKEMLSKKEKKEMKKQLKIQKTKEKTIQEAKKLFKIKGHVHIKKEKTVVEFKGGKSELSLTQGEMVGVIHSTSDAEGQWPTRETKDFYDYVKPVHVSNDDIKEEKEEEEEPERHPSDAEPDIYDSFGAPAEGFSGLIVQNAEEEENVYDDVDNPHTRDSPNPDEDDVYDDVDSHIPQLPFDGCDIYDDIREACIYEID
ncbi:FYN-binding protein 1-like [Dicentrarchus labrax]|uniref:FYN-binding protein 1-like n=1 Tax=Dicentrarchus labrax TaxID=13489 RepID=UPI0021F6869C|nr:FYN-binding protein 1-like [Dicentrarchus labrax]